MLQNKSTNQIVISIFYYLREETKGKHFYYQESTS